MKPQITPIPEVRLRDLFGHFRAPVEVFVVVDEVIPSGAEVAGVVAGVFAWVGRVGEAYGAGEGDGGVGVVVVGFLAEAEAGLSWLGRYGRRGGASGRWWRLGGRHIVAV